MMHGHWYSSGNCPVWANYNTFSIWTIMLIAGLILTVVGLVIIWKSKKIKESNVLELLKLEYVKGNITEEEYLNRKQVITRK